MKNLLFYSLIFLSVSLFAEIKSNFGPFAKEAEIFFKSYIYIQSNTAPSEQVMLKKINQSLKYALGRMHETGSFSDEKKIKVLEVEKSENINQFKISYQFNGKGVFKSDLSNIEFYTPLDVDSIYKKSNQKCHDHFESIGPSQFWYNWNPYKKDCPLRQGVDFISTQASLKFINFSQDTAPEYSRLFSDKILTSTFIFGPNSKKLNVWDPQKSLDSGALDYNRTRAYFETLGFSIRKLNKSEVLEKYKLSSNAQFVPQVEEVYKKIGIFEYRIFLVFTETNSHNSNSKYFHQMFAKVLSEDDFVVYMGHSGVGQYLDLNMIQASIGKKITMPQNKYQILFLANCIGYAYYNDMYFSLKKSNLDPNGTKNLDILSYAKEAHFTNLEFLNMMTALIQFGYGEKQKYKEIIGYNPKDFLGVTGDEDNR